MTHLGVYDFDQQSRNIKGQRSTILSYQVPASVPMLGLARSQKAQIFLAFNQNFTLAETGGAAKTPVITMDYPIASQPSQGSYGENVWVYYSTDGATFSKGTKVTAAPAADGQFQVVDSTTIKVYLPASATRYFRVYFRPAAGRLLIARKPPTESADERTFSVYETSLQMIHQSDQFSSYAAGIVLGRDAVFPSKSFVLFQIVMPDVSATQSTETGVTKTVTQAALFTPFTVDATPWESVPVGYINLPIG